jgi:hypothetical protein
VPARSTRQRCPAIGNLHSSRLVVRLHPLPRGGSMLVDIDGTQLVFELLRMLPVLWIRIASGRDERRAQRSSCNRGGARFAKVGWVHFSGDAYFRRSLCVLFRRAFARMDSWLVANVEHQLGIQSSFTTNRSIWSAGHIAGF